MWKFVRGVNLGDEIYEESRGWSARYARRPMATNRRGSTSPAMCIVSKAVEEDDGSRGGRVGLRRINDDRWRIRHFTKIPKACLQQH